MPDDLDNADVLRAVRAVNWAAYTMPPSQQWYEPGDVPVAFRRLVAASNQQEGDAAYSAVLFAIAPCPTTRELSRLGSEEEDWPVETVVQRVRTSWTKQSRGGAGAARRNSAPVAFRLPMVQAPFVHEVSMDEQDGFEPRAETHEGLGRAREIALIVREEDGLLRVLLTVTPFGMPRRWRRPPAVRLNSGEWLRWQVNYRFPGTWGGDWTYRLDTLNVAHGPASDGVFLGEPTYEVKELASLR